MENPIHLEAWRLLGVNPTPMPVSEVFTALQQHAIDGQENPVVAIYGWKFYEVNNYISLTGHVYSPLTFPYSKKLFDSYSPEDQKMIREVALKTGVRDREIARADESSYLEEISEAEATTVELSVAQKQAFQEATQPVWDSVAKKVGEELIKELKADLAKVSR
ncbi:TRAP transporter substrate-binding protein DctP [Marispirochaeta sp.]|uniref:TRAP transporter substrate-binding protein DctP n=1 Tax=Marispirochaeta sp. TaxID=2038653 RepID=UPI0029C76F26|nr:TRAP transporter substrate-binding protein DctP [Marispirochaeta sp.]